LTTKELRWIRLRLGLSQMALAKELGVTRNTVTRWELGIHPISRLAEVALRGLVRQQAESE
jgi:transcriptional regulator with XRE-family HTH domain